MSASAEAGRDAMAAACTEAGPPKTEIKNPAPIKSHGALYWLRLWTFGAAAAFYAAYATAWLSFLMPGYLFGLVVGPGGEIVFRQPKTVPLQFSKDGLPAPEQRVWASPWGKLGICIRYDLSYTRVTDRLAKLGAQAMIVLTMDAADWGEAQHKLHAHVAPVRASESGIPVFRLASSGISQCVDALGKVSAVSTFPGQGSMLCGTLDPGNPASLPLDRWLSPLSTALTILLPIWFPVKRRA